MRTICLCNTNIPWGGGEAWHLASAASLASRGWRVLLICHPAGELQARARNITGITVIPLAIGKLSFLNPALRFRLRRLFKREAVRAVIMNLPSDLKAAGPAARQAGVRSIIYRRGSALPVRDSAVNRHLFGRVITGLIANSEATRRQVLANNPELIPPERIHVIPNGLDIAAFDASMAAAGQGDPLFADWGDSATGPDRPLIIGNAGRLNRQKAQHLLLHVGKELLEAGVDCRVAIAGQGERGDELEMLAQSLNIADKVRFCGFMPDLAPFWREIDIFVLTSFWEGFGNVILEAGLARKPVFAFAVSNLPELILDGPGGNGRLFALPPGVEQAALRSRGQKEAGFDQHVLREPVLAMARALAEAARQPDRVEAMGQAGRRMALAYSQDRCMDALEALIEQDG